MSYHKIELNVVFINLSNETPDSRVDLHVLAAHFIFNGTDSIKASNK
ncbi:hypothetical protein [Bacillus pseudomycoides]|nr:hypothetical protein [Bacillus pseudomycoides]KFN11936.1 hypothetical protein DJ94_5328 [Bacillus pseudomycoides]MED0855803.1 hypothetical protein [Bacillus pseudomycoides]